jgi:hypothetical protein
VYWLANFIDRGEHSWMLGARYINYNFQHWTSKMGKETRLTRPGIRRRLRGRHRRGHKSLVIFFLRGRSFSGLIRFDCSATQMALYDANSKVDCGCRTKEVELMN